MAEIINLQLQAQKRNELNVIENTTRFKYALWLGDFWSDNKLLNEAIEDYNEVRKTKLQKVIRIVMERKFIIIHAVLILASQVSKICTRLWNKSEKSSFCNNIDFIEYMKEWRLKEIESILPSIMKNDWAKVCIDWWRFSKLIELFHKVQMKKMEKVMCSYIGRKYVCLYTMGSTYIW